MSYILCLKKQQNIDHSSIEPKTSPTIYESLASKIISERKLSRRLIPVRNCEKISSATVKLENPSCTLCIDEFDDYITIRFGSVKQESSSGSLSITYTSSNIFMFTGSAEDELIGGRLIELGYPRDILNLIVGIKRFNTDFPEYA